MAIAQHAVVTCSPSPRRAIKSIIVAYLGSVNNHGANVHAFAPLWEAAHFAQVGAACSIPRRLARTTDVSICLTGIDQYVRSNRSLSAAGTNSNPFRR